MQMHYVEIQRPRRFLGLNHQGELAVVYKPADIQPFITYAGAERARDDAAARKLAPLEDMSIEITNFG